jgi:hypothetical protein
MGRRTPLILLTAVLAVAGSLLVLGNRGGKVNLEIRLGGWRSQYENCLGESPESRASKCIQDLSTKASGSGDIGGALAILREGLTKNATLAGKCHAVVHTVGQNAIEKGVGLFETYAVPFTDCRFGFYHGALEAHTRSLDLTTIKRDLDKFCEPFGDEKNPAMGECVHVLGHFIYDRVKPEIREGLGVCEQLAAASLQGRCSDGVLMQSIDYIKPAVGNPDHERYPMLEATWGIGREEQMQRGADICSSVKTPQATYICHTNIPQALTVLWKGDYPALHAYCKDKVGAEWQQPCFEGVAAGGFAWFDWDEKKIVEACHASDNPDTKYCIGTLAFTYVLYSSPERARAICALTKEHELQTCLEQVEAGVQARDGIAGGLPTDEDYGIYSQ